jgi:sugar phosphate isomerase/epimerase
MGEIELVALYWTVSGPVEVHRGREWSLFDFADRCAQAARVGFRGIGVWHADLEHQLKRRNLQDMKAILDDNGLRYLELEFLTDWFLDESDERRESSDEARRLLLDAAGALDAHHIKIGNIPGTEASLSQITEKFAELCADAAQHTDAKIVYEIMPFDVNVHTLAHGLDVVQGAGADNGGLAIDTWHMSKLGIAPGELRAIPANLLSWIELSDGQVENMPDVRHESANQRRLPGEGEFDLPAYIRVCQEIGYRGPWGVEVLSEELRSLPIEQMFDRAHQTTVSQFSSGSTPAEGA